MLTYDGHDLVTRAPKKFKAPKKDYGEYELRPVYGYDDCFPSVRPCHFPGLEVDIQDHGEICWLPWQVKVTPNELDCTVRSKSIPTVTFRRRMLFSDRRLIWLFDATNAGETALPFVHVMHPLMPLDSISGMHVPAFDRVTSEMRGGVTLPLRTPDDCARHLLSQPVGSADMLLLRGVNSGHIGLDIRGAFRLVIEFDHKMSPTVGIWWNHAGYPGEEGIRRTECAFEPINGSNSSLADSVRDKIYSTIPAGGRASWQITWNIE